MINKLREFLFLTKGERQAVKTLRNLIKGNLKGIDKDYGLCNNIHNINITQFLNSWEHYSGRLAFPIKPYEGFEIRKGLAGDESDLYYYAPKYEGYSLEMRISLAKHILREFGKFKGIKLI